jgi:hypothetical protein
VAVAVALVLGSYLGAADEPGAAGLLGAAGAAVLAIGLVLRRGLLVTAGIALVGAGYGVSLIGAGLDGAAGLVAGGLVLAAELAYWAIEPGAAVRLGREATGRRGAFAGALALAGGILGALLVAAGSTPLDGGSGLGLAGVAAVVLVAGVSVWLIHALRNPVE